MIITQKLKSITDDKKFIKKSIAIPIALLNTTLNLVDTIMIGSLG